MENPRFQWFLSLFLLFFFSHSLHAQVFEELAKLQASDKEPKDFFGISTSISNDVAIVGALGESNSTGAAYIYRLQAGIWIEEAKIQASDGEERDEFGTNVAISGNVAIVGAQRDDASSGAAYIYRFQAGIWIEEARIQASDREANDFFGRTVDISGNVAIVGAVGEDSGANNAGAAYIYRFQAGSWIEEAKVQASDIEAEDQFGRSVSISEDVALISSLDDTGGSQAGAAYIYRFQSGTWGGRSQNPSIGQRSI